MQGSNSASYLKSYIERIERLESEKKDIADSIKDVFDAAAGNGFDKKAMKEILKLRKMTESDRLEFESTVDTYKSALGMLLDTPLGQAAMDNYEAA